MLRKLIVLIAGSLVVAAGINIFFVPNELMDGGLVGVALLMNYLWNVKVGLAIIVLSIPIFLWAWRRNRSFFYNSLFGMLMTSLFIDVLASLRQRLLLDWLEANPFHPLVGSIIGGFLVGGGIGLMLRHQISTGGTDLLAQFLAEMLMINVGLIIFVMDAIVVLAGGLLLSKETLLLSSISILAVALSTSVVAGSPEGQGG